MGVELNCIIILLEEASGVTLFEQVNSLQMNNNLYIALFEFDVLYN